MSELLPSIVVLDKGLDLQVPKLSAAPGTVLDSLNYEQVDFQGQKRIDGYVRYDGNLGSYADTFYRIGFGDVPTAVVGDIVTNDELPVGIVVGIEAPYVYLAIIDETSIPEVGDLLYSVDSGINVGTVTSVDEGRDIGLTEEQYYQSLLAYNTVLRDRVESLPGPVAGLHWFRDRLYAVASVTAVILGGDAPTIYPNDTLTITGGTALVLKVIVDQDEIRRIVFLDTLDRTLWSAVGQPVFVNAVEVGTTDGLFEPSTLASFFESRTETQALEEDGNVDDLGWIFNHLGWLVPFEEGISLFGSLPSLNQNLQGLGVQGPTSITGTDGSPLALYQKVSITNRRAQVNGWKGSDSPTNYQLNPDNVAGDDSLYTYADAFITWTTSSSTVSAPGALSGTLVERSPTAFIELED